MSNIRDCMDFNTSCYINRNCNTIFALLYSIDEIIDPSLTLK